MATNIRMDYRYKSVTSVNLEYNNSFKLLFTEIHLPSTKTNVLLYTQYIIKINCSKKCYSWDSSKHKKLYYKVT